MNASASLLGRTPEPRHTYETQLLGYTSFSDITTYRILCGVYLFSTLLASLFHENLDNPFSWFMQLASWIHICSVFFFGFCSYMQFVVNNDDLSRKTGLFRLFHHVFEVIFSISFVVAVVFWVTEFDAFSEKDPAELYFALNSHFIVFVMLFIDHMVNAIIFEMLDIVYLLSVMILYGFVDAIYISTAAPDAANWDSIIAFSVVMLFTVVAFLSGVAISTLKQVRSPISKPSKH